jgi:hypothetical protein
VLLVSAWWYVCAPTQSTGSRPYHYYYFKIMSAEACESGSYCRSTWYSTAVTFKGARSNKTKYCTYESLRYSTVPVTHGPWVPSSTWHTCTRVVTPLKIKQITAENWECGERNWSSKNVTAVTVTKEQIRTFIFKTRILQAF